MHNEKDNEGLQAPPLSLLDRYRGRDFAPLYTTTVTVSGGETGHGRASGVARSDDGNLVVDLRLPTELGGPGNGTNPEQLFAAGFAACFHGALNLLGKRANMELDDTVVEVQVAFGRDPMDGGYALVIDVRVRMPGIERAVAEEMVRNAERLCPYAKMARQGTVNVVAVID
ncbi:Organic hydroperoxide resistance protein OhrB [Paraburkholderia piptadeniae]|uniref:Organic hydroperoxide resistance protein OhrB n=1 Tax=Paraburkholderia piptadeniae TaxID=1701573 RepID=A0A1N7SQZ6_9BURK|nr:Ohr family peroxiredoxin [Paraburkholderia piptadeniae]SIT49873.1 Organic hydroperoxide resistance protein OhrB [Paraburkholderia piptadeniae]